MRSVQHLVAVCFLTVLVTVVAGNVIQDAVPAEKNVASVSVQKEIELSEKQNNLPTPINNVKVQLNENLKKENAEVEIRNKPFKAFDDKLNEKPPLENFKSEEKEIQLNDTSFQTQFEYHTKQNVTQKNEDDVSKPFEVGSSATEVTSQIKKTEDIKTNSELIENPNKFPTEMQYGRPQGEKHHSMENEDYKPLEKKVTYKGYKVLRVVLQNKEQKKMLKQLENNGDINTWMGNGTAVDILIRQNSVFDFLTQRKLVYDVVIDDLEKAIEEENPPIAEDEWSELEGRKVDAFGQWTGNAFLSPYHIWMFSEMHEVEDHSTFYSHDLIGVRRKKIKKKIKMKKRRKRGHRMTWQMYHRMADIHGYLDYLTATYPNVCSQETIGYSVEKKPLKVLKISSGKENAKAIWVDSGIHAREWITPATSTYAISQMIENGDGTHGVDWYFLPLVNPDGYEHSHMYDRLWRKNRANPYRGPCAGIDLNRNFGYRWGGQGSSQQPCRETYAGQGPFSEPETNSIKEFILKKPKEFKAYISLHSYGQYILYPWGYDRKVPPDYSDLHRVGRAMAQAMKNSGGQNYKVGSAAATLYPAAGGSDDWAKGGCQN
ncbi:hypothetical protein RUM43_003720 [Polyplax serrata]|uniref:Peptidase M14 domain-containing protein n=1 Tax=Polyplax serrata TaxID=468196 RepID=A0AAN8P0H7_POLSC